MSLGKVIMVDPAGNPVVLSGSIIVQSADGSVAVSSGRITIASGLSVVGSGMSVTTSISGQNIVISSGAISLTSGEIHVMSGAITTSVSGQNVVVSSGAISLVSGEIHVMSGAITTSISGNTVFVGSGAISLLSGSVTVNSGAITIGSGLGAVMSGVAVSVSGNMPASGMWLASGIIPQISGQGVILIGNDRVGATFNQLVTTQSGAVPLHSFKLQTIEHGGNFMVGSGLLVPSTSGGVTLAASLLSAAVTIRFTGSGRLFIGSSGYPPVGSGTTDQQRVGFPMYATFSGTVDTGTRIQISNPAFISVSAENSGQYVFYGVETLF